MITVSRNLALQHAKRTSTLLLLLITLFISGAALASGGGSYGGGSSSNATKIDSERYALGKQIYKNNVNCAGCIIDQPRLSKREAKNLYKQAKRDKNLRQSLSKQEYRAMRYYMQKRFKL
ncbi:MAG: hypothetical protein JKY90_09715 [Gammaproteobacteria bacterium]|nr:hypothetical protein [Gammaproteobacteria bacterium]